MKLKHSYHSISLVKNLYIHAVTVSSVVARSQTDVWDRECDLGSRCGQGLGSDPVGLF